MKTPIVAYNYGDVLVFEKVEFLQGYIEPQDVEDDEYIVFDSEGRLLQLVLRTPNEIIVQEMEDNPTHVAQLQQIMSGFLSRRGVSKEWLQQASLEQLIDRGLEYKTEW
jgi:hypothetical protein